MIHPFAARWREQRRSPYRILLPLWTSMWIVIALATWRWRNFSLYSSAWVWLPAALLFTAGIFIYVRSSQGFSPKQLGGLPEVHGKNREQQLVTDGIRSRVRHPIYVAHLCEMLAWSVGTGLAVSWGLTAFAISAGALMIRTEDAELELRFGDAYRAYCESVPAVLPRLF